MKITFLGTSHVAPEKNRKCTSTLIYLPRLASIDAVNNTLRAAVTIDGMEIEL